MILQTGKRDLKTLITLAELKARDHGGHLTITRNDLHWQAWLGPYREQTQSLQGYESLEDALSYLIIGEPE